MLKINLSANTSSGGTTEASKHGAHHFGFCVADFVSIEATLTEAGPTQAFDLGDPEGMNYERKWLDPEGILFDVSEKGWSGAPSVRPSRSLKTLRGAKTRKCCQP